MADDKTVHAVYACSTFIYLFSIILLFRNDTMHLRHILFTYSFQTRQLCFRCSIYRAKKTECFSSIYNYIQHVV